MHFIHFLSHILNYVSFQHLCLMQKKIHTIVLLSFLINESELLILSCYSLPPKFALYFVGLVLLLSFFYFIVRRLTSLPYFASINRSQIVYLNFQHYHFYNLFDLLPCEFQLTSHLSHSDGKILN